eukprot:4445136-Pyramimonas_sp.AAC.1
MGEKCALLTRQPRARCARFPEKHLFNKARYVLGQWQTVQRGMGEKCAPRECGAPPVQETDIVVHQNTRGQ